MFVFGLAEGSPKGKRDGFARPIKAQYGKLTLRTDFWPQTERGPKNRRSTSSATPVGGSEGKRETQSPALQKQRTAQAEKIATEACQEEHVSGRIEL
jgi:hypothetical protein